MIAMPFRIVTIAAIVLSTGCESTPSSPPLEKTPQLQSFDGRAIPFGALIRKRLVDLRDLIRGEIGTPASDAPADCGVIPIGSKVCGGPTGYLVFSKRASDEERMRALADQYTETEQDWNRASGAASDCGLLMPPEVLIVNGRCKASYKEYGFNSEHSPGGW